VSKQIIPAPQDMGVMELCERLASYATATDSEADYRARQAAVWDKMNAGIARNRNTQ
jgi:hypothetical protein